MRKPEPPAAPTQGEIAVQVWDPFLRVFHWALVLLFIAAYISGSRPSYYRIHEASGIAILGLVIFRILWGFAGPRSARFSDFLRGPRAAIAHLRELLSRRHRPVAGHNPLGGWAVLAILLLVLAEVVSGLFASTFDYDGPLARFIPGDWAAAMADVHAANLNLLLAILFVHLTGVALTSVLGHENLVASMIHGRKYLPAGSVVPDRPLARWRGPLVIGIAVLAVWALLSLTALKPPAGL
jgi:cytochrome b